MLTLQEITVSGNYKLSCNKINIDNKKVMFSEVLEDNNYSFELLEGTSSEKEVIVLNPINYGLEWLCEYDN